MPQEEEKKPFTITDRRFSSRRTEEREDPSRAREAARPTEPPTEEVDFSSFIFSLANSALISLGEISDPLRQTSQVYLEGAKQMIDILAILQEKTRGNLTPDEDQLLMSLLSDLRIRYVNRARAGRPRPGP
jgi:hypothetical protein